MSSKSINPLLRSLKTEQPSEVPLDGNIDHAILAAGYLVLIGWFPTEASPQTMWVGTDGAKSVALHPKFVRVGREDVTLQLKKHKRPSPLKPGFVCSLQLPTLLFELVYQALKSNKPIKVGLEYGVGTGTVRFRTVSIMSGANAIAQSIFVGATLQMAAQASTSHPSDPSLRVLASLSAPPQSKSHIDLALTFNRSEALIVGWLENAIQGRIALISADLCTAPEFLEPVITAREDVTLHLRETEHCPETNMHGVVAVASIKAKRYRFCHLQTNDVKWTSEFEIAARQVPVAVALENVRRFAAESMSDSGIGFYRLSRHLIGSEPSREPEVAQVITFLGADSTEEPIKTSIIVPFYGDAFYLVDHIMAQSRASAGIEWIFVCDDPRLAAGMVETISNARRYLKQPTRLVLLSGNGGYAHANNIGARLANGEYLLLMNSDVYCEDFDFLRAGTQAMDSDSTIGCAGFTLQFEDGTIQHEGMKFQKSALLNDLWVCEHPNKGMPQHWKKFEITRVPAVTAALALLRSRDFAGATIFDPAYIIGDFEDADLCLSIRRQGHSIVLVQSPGIFHLERQSMKLTGNNDARMAVTHMNCYTFNQRWHDTLVEINVQGGTS